MNWREALRSAVASRAEWDAGTEQSEARRHGSTPLAKCQVRQRIEVVGVLRSVTYPPAGTPPVLRADLYDGSDIVELIWQGRRSIAGIEPGRRVAVEGMLCEGGPARRERVLYNPAYRLLSSAA